MLPTTLEAGSSPDVWQLDLICCLPFQSIQARVRVDTTQVLPFLVSLLPVVYQTIDGAVSLSVTVTKIADSHLQGRTVSSAPCS